MNFENRYKKEMERICFNDSFGRNAVESMKAAADRKEIPYMKKNTKISATIANQLPFTKREKT